MNSPQAFDEEKYQALLGGLECSEVLLSELERTARIDAEFYSKENLNIASKLQQYKTKPITEQFYISDGNHMSVSNDFRTEGIPYYRGQDTNNIFIENASPICISEEYYQQKNMLRSHLKKNDILLSIVGTIGNTCMVYSSEKATCSCKLAILRPKNATIKPFLVNVFLMSKYGQNQIKKFVRGAVQTGFLLEDMEQLLIPSLGEVFGNTVQKLMEKIHLLIEQSKSAYTSAETLLLKSLNLQNFTPTTKNTSVKTFAETFASGRLDAEYYQAKYDEIEERIKSYKYGYSIVGKCFQPVKDDFDRKENSYPYIEIGDVNIGTATAEHNIISTEDLPDNAKIKVKAGDILVSKVRPNRGAVTIVKDIPNLIVSGAFCVLRSTKAYSPETLLVLLRTAVYKEWLLKWNVGTSYPVIKDKDVYNLPIPLLPEPIQAKISAKVREYFALREQSKTLLKAAVKAVETAIEEGEEKAMAHLEKYK